MKVVKFGGSSLADAAQFRKVAEIVKSDPDRRFVVASAPGKRYRDDVKVTDMLYHCYDMVRNHEDISAYYAQIAERYNGIIRDLGLKFDISGILGTGANIVLNIAIGLIDQIFSIIVGIILSVYFLIHSCGIFARIKKGLVAIFKKETYEKVIDFAKYADKTFGKYLVGTICDSMVVGLVVGLLMGIFQMPHAVLIGFIVGITNIIPFFGPFIGAIPSILLLLLVNPWHSLIFGIFIIILHYYHLYI